MPTMRVQAVKGSSPQLFSPLVTQHSTPFGAFFVGVIPPAGKVSPTSPSLRSRAYGVSTALNDAILAHGEVLTFSSTNYLYHLQTK